MKCGLICVCLNSPKKHLKVKEEKVKKLSMKCKLKKEKALKSEKKRFKAMFC